MKRMMISSILAAILIMPGLLSAADINEELSGLLKQIPAQTAQQRTQVFSRMIKLGPAGVESLCDRLLPPGGDDLQVRYALSGLARYVQGAHVEKDRQVFVQSVLKGLQNAENPEVKAFLIFLLQLTGREDAVQPLEGYLTDKRLCDPAARALTAIGSDSAGDALLAAIPSVDSRNKIALVKALGELRYQPAGDTLMELARSKDREMKLAALWALSNMAQPRVEYLLSEAMNSESVYIKSKATSYYLLFVEQLADSGKAKSAVRKLQELLRSRTAPLDAHVQCAALSLMVKIEGGDALDELLSAMDSPNEQLQGTAVLLAGKIPGPEATEKWMAKLPEVSVSARVKILNMLGRRGDKTALPALFASLKDTNRSVRMAAIPGAIRLGRMAAISALMPVFEGDLGDEVALVKQCLLQLDDKGIFPAIGDILPLVPYRSRIALMEVLAARQARPEAAAVWLQTKSDDRQIRVAAYKALESLADFSSLQRLLNALVQTTSTSEQEAIQKVLLKVLGGFANVDERSGPVLQKFYSSNSTSQAILLKLLSKIGGEKALQAVISSTNSDVKEVKAAAVRALANWPDKAALPALLELAEATDSLTNNVLAIRGAVRILSKADLAGKEKVGFYEKLLLLARRDDEKKQILAGLASVKSLDALKVAVVFLDDAELKEEAAQAVVGIVCPSGKKGRGLHGRPVYQALKKVIDAAENSSVVKRARDYLNILSAPDNDNLAQGQPVKTSVGYEADHRPELAVDGNSADSSNSAWYGKRWPCWYMVDLGAVQPIDTVQVFFYWNDPRYYQYTVEVSADGQNWKQVVDRSNNELYATAEGVLDSFAPVEARYVRLNILKNSANQAVHLVEFKVFARNGKHPQQVGGQKQTAPIQTVLPEELQKPKLEPIPPTPLNVAPPGFTALFNGRDLTNWKGLMARPYDNPYNRQKLSPEERQKRQAAADESARQHWKVEDGILKFDGKGFSLATVKKYGDFELLVDWKIIHPRGDSGIYLRGTPQVQIWDPGQWKIGSGGLYNNKIHPSKALVIADNPIGQWNRFRIIMIGERVTVYLNGKLVVDNVILENYWNRNMPIFSEEQIELQCHGDPIHFRNIFIREIPRKGPFQWRTLFNGEDLTGWQGDTKGYIAKDGVLICKPGGNLYTKDEFSDFIFRFQFKLTPGANNGLGIRAPGSGDAAYAGMELQILDNTAPQYAHLHPYQYHGSVYGVIPAKRGFLKPVGQWNFEEVIARGHHIIVNLNDHIIVDGDIAKASANGTMDHRNHPGLLRPSGHIGFLGHGSVVEFRNIRIKPLK